MLLTTDDLALDQDTGALGWTPVIAEENPAGIINHLHWGQGGRLLTGPGSSPEALNDGSPGRGWSSLSGSLSNNLDFTFDSDWDGSTGDAVSISEIFIYNNGDSTGVEKFQVEVKTLSNPDWTRLVADPSPAGDINFLENSNGGLVTASVGSFVERIHDGTPGTGWSSTSGSYTNELDFAFDHDNDGTTSADGDTDDLFTLRQINLYNNGDSTGVEKFQVEVRTLGNPNWTRLVADPSPTGDINFLQSSDGGLVTASVGSFVERIHDGTPGTGWSSTSGSYTNNLDFAFDHDNDGTTSADGDTDDLFTLRQINLYNNGDSTGVQDFQIEVRTVANPVWSPVLFSGSSTVTALRSWNQQIFIPDTPINDVIEFRLHTVNNYGHSLTRIREIEAIGDAIGPSHTFIALRSWNQQIYTLDNPVVDVTEMRFRTLDNYGHSLTRMREIEAIGDAIGSSHTFTALRTWNQQIYTLDNPVVDVTEMRFRTLDNYGHSLTRMREIEAIGDAIGSSHTFTALRTWNQQIYTLDNPVVDVTEMRFRTLDNYGHSLTRMREIEAIGDAIGPSYTFIAQRSWNLQTYALDAAVNDVTEVRFHTIDNYGHSLTRVREFGVSGITSGPAYVFNALRNSSEQVYNFTKATGRLFRLRTFDNYGHSLTRTRSISLESTDCNVLAGHWRMEEAAWGSVLDEVAGNNGIAYNGADTVGSSCRYGLFDGIDDYVQIPHDPTLNGSDALTYVAFIRADSWDGVTQIMAKSVHGGGSGRAQMGIFSEGGVLKGRAETSAGRYEIQMPLTLIAGDWDHIALVFDGTSLTLYQNGISQVTTSFSSTTLVQTTDPINISKRVGTSAYYFHGLIDDVRVYTTALTAQDVLDLYNTLTPCSFDSVDHIEISNDGTALTCAPETLNIKACADAGCTSVATTDVEVTLSTTGGASSWSSNPVTIPGNSSTGVNIALTHQTAETITLSTSSTPTATNSLVCSPVDCNLMFSETGFLLSLPNHSSCSTSSLIIQAVRMSDTGTSCAPAYSGNQSVDFSFNYANPVSGTTIPLLDSSNMAGAAIVQNRTVNFDGSASATLDFEYRDAGQLTVTVADGGSNGLTSSDVTTIVTPAKLNVSTGDVNASCIGPDYGNCSSFKVAGIPGNAASEFNLTVEGACADNTVTPNFQLSSIPLSSNLVAPSGGSNASLGVSSVDISSGGTVTVSETISEVGAFSITATPPNYLGQAIPAATSSTIGRFIPDRFTLTDNSPLFDDATCNFTYQDQAFNFAPGLEPELTLTAVNSAGATTLNYGGDGVANNDFWKLDASLLSSRTYTNQVASFLGTLTASLGAITISDETDYDGMNLFLFTSDQLTYNKSAVVPVATNDANFNANVTLDLTANSLTDSDGVSYDPDDNGIADLFSSNAITGTNIRWGRWFIANAFGSEIQPLPMVAEAQYFNGSNFVINTDDTDVACSTYTPLDDTDVTLTNYTGNLNIGETTLPSTLPDISSGLVPLILSAPGNGNDGSSLITLTTPLWMMYDYDGDGTADNASSTATFGIFEGREPVIIRRQSY